MASKRSLGHEEQREQESGSTATAAPSLAGINDQAAFTASLARSGAAARAQAMHSIQASAGNAAAARMISAQAAGPEAHRCGPGCGHGRVDTSASNQSLSRQASPATKVSDGSIVKSAPFSARIQVGPTRIPAAPRPATSTLDSVEQKEPTKPEEIPVDENPLATIGEKPAPAAEGAEAKPAEAGAAPEGAAPEKIKIAEIRKPELEQAHCCDAISGLMMYQANIIHGTNVPNDAFGICRFGDVRIKDVSIERMDFMGSILVLGIIENRILWEVHALGRTDISGPNDPDIKQSKYTDVVSDLTPNMSSSGGRPPRREYWAQDLTERHEQFHAHDVEGQGQGAVSAAVTWLEGQTAASVAGARALVNQIPNRVVQTLAAGMGEPAEVRAYGDGAPAYRSRADTIQVTGDAELYDA